MKIKFVCMILLICLSSCLETKKEGELTFLIKTTKKTNLGTPLYVVVKETSTAQYLTQEYNEVAAQSLETSGIVKKVLVPGTTTKISIPAPAEDKPLGVYFLFTKPGDCWKYILNDPKASKVKISLGENEYKSINVFE